MNTKLQKYQMTMKKKGIETDKLPILLEDKTDVYTECYFEREQNIFMQKLWNWMIVKILRYAWK